MQEITTNQEILSLLKYVRGDNFAEKHWTELFNILDMPAKKIEDLKFSDFLDKKLAIIEKEDALVELNNKAAGEVVIKDALDELDIWEIETKFTFVKHETSLGDNISLIKDWKEILNSVGDNQVHLQSIKGKVD